MEQRLTLVTLGVTDLERARAFYEALGWRTRAEPDADVVFFQSGGMVVALWDRARLAEDSCVEDGGGWGGVTLAHNVRSSDDVDDVIDRYDTCHAPFSIDETIPQVVDTLLAQQGMPGLRFIDRHGETVPW